MTTVRISPCDNDLGPITEIDRAALLRRRRCGSATARRTAWVRGMHTLLSDESDEEGIFFRITLFFMIILILSLCQILFPNHYPFSFTLGICHTLHNTTSLQVHFGTRYNRVRLLVRGLVKF